MIFLVWKSLKHFSSRSLIRINAFALNTEKKCIKFINNKFLPCNFKFKSLKCFVKSVNKSQNQLTLRIWKYHCVFPPKIQQYHSTSLEIFEETTSTESFYIHVQKKSYNLVFNLHFKYSSSERFSLDRVYYFIRSPYLILCIEPLAG